MISQASAPATVAHRNPTKAQPTTTVAVATATRMTASVTISAPYCVQRLVPASMPSNVACRQNPASPTLSRPTESQWACANTRPLHSGELAAITIAAPIPTSAATRSGWVRASGSTSAYAGGANFPGGFLQQAVGRPGDQPERSPEDRENGEAGGRQVAGGQVHHRVAAHRGHRGRDANPGHAAAGDRAGEGSDAGAAAHFGHGSKILTAVTDLRMLRRRPT